MGKKKYFKTAHRHILKVQTKIREKKAEQAQIIETINKKEGNMKEEINPNNTE